MSVKAEVSSNGTDVLVRLSGMLDEFTVFPTISEPPRGRMILDMEGVTLIDSLGCRKWVQWIKTARATGGITLVRCSPTVVKQLNILTEFIPDDTLIESVFVPYWCEGCEFEEKKLVEIVKLDRPFDPADVVEKYQCPKCGAKMELDLVKSQYFAFVEKQQWKLAKRAASGPSLKK